MDQGIATTFVDPDWRTTDPGVERAALVETGSVTRGRIRAGASLPDHGHDRHEHVIVRSGLWRVGDHRILRPGDVLATPTGDRHAGTAIVDTELWAVEQGAPGARRRVDVAGAERRVS